MNPSDASKAPSSSSNPLKGISPIDQDQSIPESSWLEGQYNLIRKLGEGGEGSVFEAQAKGTEESVALKIIEFSGLRPEEISAIGDEFRWLRKLSHPSISRVIDFGFLKNERGAYFTSELIQGVDLLSWASDNPLEKFPETWVTLLHHGLDALTAIDQAGAYHGDIKPSNLLISSTSSKQSTKPSDYKLTVIDFGGAGSQRGALSQGIRRKRTPAYLPHPQQQDGAISDDLFALGLSFFHAAQGRLPFRIDQLDSHEKWLNSEKPATLEGNFSSVPRAFIELLKQLTQPRREDRFTTQEVTSFLKRQFQHRPSTLASKTITRCVGRTQEIEVLSTWLQEPLSVDTSGLFNLYGQKRVGKTTIIKEVLAEAQLEGMTTLILKEESRALSTLEENLGSQHSQPGALLTWLEKLSQEKLLIYIGSIESILKSKPVLHLLEEVSKIQAPGFKSRIIIETTAPLDDEKFSLSSLRTNSLQIFPLKKEASLQFAQLFFQSKILPENVFTHLYEKSRGLPGEFMRLLQSLSTAGSGKNSEGEFIVPPDWEEKITNLDQSSQSSDLNPPLETETKSNLFELFESLLGIHLTLREWHQLVESFIESLNPKSTLHSEVSEFLRDPKEFFEKGLWTGEIQKWNREDIAFYSVLNPALQRVQQTSSGLKESPHSISLRKNFSKLFQREELKRLTLIQADVPHHALLLAQNAELSRAVSVLKLALRHCSTQTELKPLLKTIDQLLQKQNQQPAKLFWLAIRASRNARSLGATKKDLQVIYQHCQSLNSLARNSREKLFILRELIALSSDLTDNSKLEDFLQEMEEVLQAANRNREVLHAIRLFLFIQSKLSGLQSPQGDLKKRSSLAKKLMEDQHSSASPNLKSLVMTALLANWAAIEAENDNLDFAVLLSKKAELLAHRLSHLELEERATHELATLHARQGNYSASQASFQRSWEICKQNSDTFGELKTLVNLATLSFKFGHLQEAKARFEEARQMSERLGPNRYRTPILMGLEVIAKQEGNHLLALRYLKRVLRQNRLIDPTVRLNALFNLGDVYLSLGRFDKALRVRLEGLNESKTLDLARQISRAHLGVARIFLEIGELERAKKHFQEAQSGLIDHQQTPLLMFLSAQLLSSEFTHPSPTLSQQLHEFKLAYRQAKNLGQSTYQFLASLSILEIVAQARHPRITGNLLNWFQQDFSTGSKSQKMPFNLLNQVSKVIFSDDELKEADLNPFFQQPEASFWESLQAKALILRSLSWKRIDNARSFKLEFATALLKARRGLEHPDKLEPFLLKHRPNHREQETSPNCQIRQKVNELYSIPSPLDDLIHMPQFFESFKFLLDTLNQAPPSLKEQAAYPNPDSLEYLRQGCDLHCLSLLGVPSSNLPEILTAAGSDEASFSNCVQDHQILNSVRETGEDQFQSHWALVRLPNFHPPRSAPLLFVSFKDATELEDLLTFRKSLVGCLKSFLSYSIHAHQLSHEAEKEKQQRVQLSEELRSLHTHLIQQKSQLETAVISQRQEPLELRRSLGEGNFDLEAIEIFQSSSMKEIVSKVRRLANTDIPVLFTGEHGVGKDFFARFLHQVSRRSQAPFMGQGCELPEALIESELFGVAQGAFSGAESDRDGLLVNGMGGTLYLDRIEDLPPTVQSKLLRVIEQKKVRPLGSSHEVEVDFRVVSSSLLQREELLERDSIRKDFLSRIQGEVITLPPLRERTEDLPPLVDLLLTRISQELSIPKPEITPQAIEFLKQQPLDGNIRELEIILRRASIDRPQKIGPDNLKPLSSETDPLNSSQNLVIADEDLPTLTEARQSLELQLMEKALRKFEGNATHAAEALGVSRRYFGTLLKKYEIQPSDYKSSK